MRFDGPCSSAFGKPDRPSCIVHVRAILAPLVLFAAASCSAIWGFDEGTPAGGSGVGGAALGGAGTGAGSAGGSGAGGACSAFETIAVGERSGTDGISGVTTDTFLQEDTPDAAHGSEPDLWLFEGAGVTRIALVRFDLSTLPSAQDVRAAELRLFTCSAPECAIAFAHVKMFRVLEQWDAVTATWTVREAGSPWSTAGAGAPSSTDPTPFQEHYVGAAEPSTEIVIPWNEDGVALVQDWMTDPASNFGIALVIADDDGGLQSSESAIADERPLLSFEARSCP